MKTTFHPEVARKLRARYELRLGDVVVNLRVDNGKLTAAEGPVPDADLVIETGPGLRSLMAGEISAEEAVQAGSVSVSGDSALLPRFAEIFHID
jgi:putative sterol carrier protein